MIRLSYAYLVIPLVVFLSVTIACTNELEVELDDTCKLFISNLQCDWEEINQNCTNLGQSSFFDTSLDISGKCLDTTTEFHARFKFYSSSGEMTATSHVVHPYQFQTYIGNKIKLAFCARYATNDYVVLEVYALYDQKRKKTNTLTITLPKPKGAI